MQPTTPPSAADQIWLDFLRKHNPHGHPEPTIRLVKLLQKVLEMRG